MYKPLVLFAACFTFVVVVVGAYVRLSDAGLGCPDWPGCYGQISVPSHENDKALAQQAYPKKPLETAKAWKEMVHRYLAGILGILIFAILVSAIKKYKKADSRLLLIPVLLAGMVILQASLGMWTVTLLLKPAIVTAHLIGGMVILSLLVWHALQQYNTGNNATENSKFKMFALLGLLLLVVQIILGGWVSSNYAALACNDFPLCHDQLVPAMDFANAFHVRRELGMTAQGALLSLDALTAIHWTHRLGALIVFLYLGILAAYGIASGKIRSPGILVLGLLLIQLCLGIANVLLSLPLPIAVAHNAGAALLLTSMVILNFKIRHA
jgi:cytochrome c oxidase assembly protein subunit 15